MSKKIRKKFFRHGLFLVVRFHIDLPVYFFEKTILKKSQTYPSTISPMHDHRLLPAPPHHLVLGLILTFHQRKKF